MATGLLIVAVNRATKFSIYFLKSDKSYSAEVHSGDFTIQMMLKVILLVTQIYPDSKKV